jgi:3D (Asp-Asp-Asp) domain-containing protein
VFAYGAARSYGSLLGHRPAGGVTAITATPDGRGYWMASADGGVFAFGDARFYGSLGKAHLSSHVVGMNITQDGKGYWLATAGGGVYSFGDAKFYGCLSGVHLGTPVVGMAATATGNGYWLATAGGGVFSFGGAKFFGSLSSGRTWSTVSAIAAARAGQGYWLLGDDGDVHGFGAAADLGSGVTTPRVAATTIAPTGDGHGYVLGTAVPSASLDSERREAALAEPVPPRTYLGTFMVTCYDLTGITASGAMAGPDSVAVDPSVIPLGAQIYIDGVGQRTADDTGGAIIGDHVDIWEPSYSQCVDWGVRQRAVYRVG